MSFLTKTVIAATTAFALSNAAAAEEIRYEPVPATALNNCVATVLQGQTGTLTSGRAVRENGSFTDSFHVNASPAASQGHHIGTLVVVDGTLADGAKTIQIRGLHDGTVENDNGRSAVDFAVTGDARDVQKPMDGIMVSGDRPWDKPLVNPETVRANTVQVVRDIRTCMAAAPTAP